MIDRISESEEREIYESRFEDDYEVYQCEIDGYFTATSVYRDEMPKWLSFTALNSLIKQLIILSFIAEKMVYGEKADEGKIEVYSDNDPLFSGPCLRRYVSKGELAKKIAKDLSLAVYTYAIEKAVESGDRFSGYLITGIAVHVSGIKPCTDYAGSDKLWNAFLKAAKKSSLTEEEFYAELTKRRYIYEINQNPELMLDPEDWITWKEEIEARYRVEVFSSEESA